jgi:anti-sigma-K factor RskA
VAIVPRVPQAPASVAVASIGPLKAGTPAFIARVLPDGGLSIAAVAPAAVPSGRDLQLWALPVGATQVTSLGVLPATGRVIPPSALVAPGGKLLVSLEPKGGSPTGKPTGPVLYGGVITRL